MLEEKKLIGNTLVKKSKNFKPVLDLLNEYVLYEAWGNILNKMIM